MRSRASRLMADIKPHNLTERAGGIVADLKAIGLTIHDETANSFEFDADHRHRLIYDEFMKNGWRLTFNGKVVGGVHQAAYEHDIFGGGKAVLHFKGDRVYFVTISFSRDYRD